MAPKALALWAFSPGQTLVLEDRLNVEIQRNLRVVYDTSISLLVKEYFTINQGASTNIFRRKFYEEFTVVGLLQQALYDYYNIVFSFSVRTKRKLEIHC